MKNKIVSTKTNLIAEQGNVAQGSVFKWNCETLIKSMPSLKENDYKEKKDTIWHMNRSQEYSMSVKQIYWKKYICFKFLVWVQ